MGTKRHDRDLFKDTPVRYLGYANEIGEALRSFIGSKWVNVSYGISTLYVCADTIDKTTETYKLTSGKSDCAQKTAFVATDTLLWQMLASVIIPGFTINRVCYISDYLLRQNSKFPSKNRQILVTGIGLAIIPFIIKPIDRLVDKVLDETFRKLAP